MKFGKRLSAEADRHQWREFYVDYKQLKHAIQTDVQHQGAAFERALRAELQKVASFYVEKEEELACALSRLGSTRGPHALLAALRAELHDLKKYAVLNYVAVIKACKKRNRHLQAACNESSVRSVRAVTILSAQHFFTSPRLAALSTQAEILAKELQPQPQPVAELLQEYTCPICLSLLRSPVVLSCEHRFCWGCLLAQCSAAAHYQGGAMPPGAKPDKEETGAVAMDASSSGSAASSSGSGTSEGSAVQLGSSPSSVLVAERWEGDSSDEERPAVCTFDCAVCRKAQLLNLDRLQVDPHLDSYIQKLERQQRSLTQQQQQQSNSLPIPIGQAAAAARAVQEAMSLDEAKPQQEGLLAAHSSAAEQQTSAEEVQEEGAAPPAAAAAVAAAPLPAACAPAAVAPQPLAAAPAAGMPQPLLPPQLPRDSGKLVVCLDLDGTLVSTFTPKRAPRLPSSSVSYVVGRGGKLNPGGVFVVERPGLGEFFRRIAPFSEVVLFTAGLQDYAEPICDALQSKYGCFLHRLYRPATVNSEVYPCVKDMELLGRDLRRCVLVDDTPLAFFHQPDNGIPVLQFRGDVDDRLLSEAVAPLLEALHQEGDVTTALARRFSMQRWFAAQGLHPGKPAAHTQRVPSMPLIRAPAAVAPLAPATAAVPTPLHEASAAQVLHHNAASGVLLCCDFDKTIMDYDAGERLTDELAPELTSLLSQMQMPANFIPVTNTVLGEMQRRGVSRDKLVGTLRQMGSEMPAASARMLQWASRRSIDTVILSDCNSVFIGHMLTGARVNMHVRAVVTNPAAFERVDAPITAGNVAAGAAASGSWFFGRQRVAPTPPKGMHHRLVITPRFDYHGASHGCQLCPANLCKGQELGALRTCSPYRRVVYCGDGANDLCPALRLGPGDVVLARRGHALEGLIAARAGTEEAVRASVRVWGNHEELARMVQEEAL